MSITTFSKNLMQLLKKVRKKLHKYFGKKRDKKKSSKNIVSVRRKYNRKKCDKNLLKKITCINKKKYKKNASKKLYSFQKRGRENPSKKIYFIKRKHYLNGKKHALLRQQKRLISSEAMPITTESAHLQKEQTLKAPSSPICNTLQNPASAECSLTSNTPQNPTDVASIPTLNASLLATLSPITQLPTKVFVRQPGQPETTIGWWLTVEMLNELIGQFLNGYINRLAMSWGARELILLHNKGNHDIILKPDSGTYACLFFDNKNSNWYALVSLPEVYAVVESNDVVYVPFGLGTLPNYMIHDDTRRIKQHLNEIVEMVANPHGSPAFMTWSPQCYRFETYPRYHIAKRLYGGYTAEQEPCRINAKFYIPVAPIRLAYADCRGTQSNYAYKPRNKSEVQEVLVTYMMGKLSLLILSWHFPKNSSSENGTLLNRHIILLQDQGCHQMLYLDDSKKYLCYLVSDVNEYMKAEGNHYRKVIFRGKSAPAYLVHENLCRIRDYTDLLLTQIEEPNAILNLFGEFSYYGETYEQIVEEFFVKE